MASDRDVPGASRWLEYVIGAVIALLLSTLIAPALLPRRPGCDFVSIVETRIVDLADAVAAYRRKTSELPTGLEALIMPDARGHRFLWRGALVDAWNRPHLYEVHDDGTFEIATYGEDGKPGGEGIDQDVTLSMVREWQR